MGPDRHLVLDSSGQMVNGALLVTIACADQPGEIPYDDTQHTFLTGLVGCPACRAVHAAWHVAYTASLELEDSADG